LVGTVKRIWLCDPEREHTLKHTEQKNNRGVDWVWQISSKGSTSCQGKSTPWLFFCYMCFGVCSLSGSHNQMRLVGTDRFGKIFFISKIINAVKNIWKTAIIFWSTCFFIQYEKRSSWYIYYYIISMEWYHKSCVSNGLRMRFVVFTAKRKNFYIKYSPSLKYLKIYGA
jgi:hypothetical protein